MILLPFLKKGALLLALCGMLGGGVLSAQETGSVPITEAGLKALDSNVFTNDFMLALKPNVTRDRIAKIKDPFVRGLARQMAEKKYDRKARAITAEPYEPVKDLADRLRTSQYSKFENPTGIFFEEGEDVLLVMEDPKGEKLNLVVTEAAAPTLSRRESTSSRRKTRGWATLNTSRPTTRKLPRCGSPFRPAR